MTISIVFAGVVTSLFLIICCFPSSLPPSVLPAYLEIHPHHHHRLPNSTTADLTPPGQERKTDRMIGRRRWMVAYALSLYRPIIYLCPPVFQHSPSLPVSVNLSVCLSSI